LYIVGNRQETWFGTCFDWQFKPAVVKPSKQEADRKAGENKDWIRVRFRAVP